MSTIEVGSLLTLPLHGSACALAHVIHVEELPLGRYYHLALLDALPEAGPEGYSALGEYLPRTHDLSSEEEHAPQVIDHLALVEDALLSSAPMVVGWREVEREDTLGYRTWVTLYHEDATRRGLVMARKNREEEPDAEEVNGDEPDNEGGEEVGEMADGANNVSQPEEEIEMSDEGEEGTLVSVRPWHRSVFADPFGPVVFSLIDEFRRDDALRASVLGGFIAGLYSEERTEEIDGLVERLADGDFSASQELAMFGDAAVPVLEQRLVPEADPQFVEDALLAMTTIGTDRALGAIAATFDAFAGAGTPLSAAVERGYLNALTMTGGTGDRAADSARIDKVTNPDLAEDVRNARVGIASQE